ncbi:hypothetical protein WM2015_1439 [Wenzhouxiangella marina]|uniref:GNAT family N-acetyltransferase n=2 Tax=Wenzhouxiangella marina TaxID=1579979 RepID=A0A0K0XW18_9GAMM|nr:hypothetical protein WM2015_1439 [Wenzhouxiangella marina]
MDWRFLAALEDSGCLEPGSGWQPCPILVEDGQGQPLAAASAYLKQHSHGEFVFDWAWARAAEQTGLSWYPKLLVGAPFSPVSGPRLLGAESHPDAARTLIQALETMVESHRLSSAGINFCDRHDIELLREAGWLERFDWQFHWHNPGYRDFEDFLSMLKRKPRKNIRAERRRVQEAGWRFEWVSGEQMQPADLDLAERCYHSTFALYGNLPSLNRAFFERVAESFGPDFLICKAILNGQARAAAIFWRDRERLYGRYWGSLEDTRDVHFETCFYQGIDYCIRNGLRWFEPGAQGEHKIRRGFLPQKTHSFHLIRHPAMRQAIARHIEAEGAAMMRYRQHLEALNPMAESIGSGATAAE